MTYGVFREGSSLTIRLPLHCRELRYDVFTRPDGALQINMHAGDDEVTVPQGWKHYGTYTADEWHGLYHEAVLENITPDDIPLGMYELIDEREGNMTMILRRV